MVSTALDKVRSDLTLRRLAQFEEPEPNYTQLQHEAWRHLRLVSHGLLVDNAHSAYQHGISLIDMPVDYAPQTSFIDEKLNSVDFGAMGVNGFIPSKAFMGLQLHSIAPMSTDVRDPEYIGYTPSPDRWHEGFGHTIMLADPRYRRMIKLFGELGLRAKPSPEDDVYYDATRHLSILAADSTTTQEQNDRAYEIWSQANEAAHRAASDARRLSALHWFTIEFGVDNETHNPLLWGAALFSSLSEGRQFKTRNLQPFSLKTAEAQYNITQQQETLYVTNTLDHVIDVLEEFRHTMGSPDPKGLESITKPAERTHAPQQTRERNHLNLIYQCMRACRKESLSSAQLPTLWKALKKRHPYDVLCPLGILEQLVKYSLNPDVQDEIRSTLPSIPSYIEGRNEKDTREKREGAHQAIADRLALLDEAA